MELMDHQLEAVEALDNGKILYGNVGSGKSLTALEYYMRREADKDLYVITTAKKRDSLDWEGEAASFGIGTRRDGTVAGIITIDSWNNIGKYVDVKDAFFIFDEQRLVGAGAWVRHFYKIAKKNRWIMLSATPGDTWMDYIPVFVANGFYKNRTEFKEKHVIYEPMVKFPKVKGYLGERKLEMLRNEILVEAPFYSHTRRILNYLDVGIDGETHMKIWRERWNPFENRPVKDAAENFRLLRQVTNSHMSRVATIKCLTEIHPRLIIFYNWDYELEILRKLKNDGFNVLEWNGHKKDALPEGTDVEWIYLVQYLSGAEGWNCITTDAMVFYSLTSSYRYFMQAQGRIDRLNTPYTDLRYYILVSDSPIDKSIKFSLQNKRDFNEGKFIRDQMLFPEPIEACEVDWDDFSCDMVFSRIRDQESHEIYERVNCGK